MKKVILMGLLMLSIFLIGCTGVKTPVQNQAGTQPNDDADKSSVVSVVESFGSKLQAVSLLAPADTVSQSIQDNYGDLVSPALLAQWRNDPQNAPGRTVSSPWPDRIEILTTEKLADDKYQVKGEIIEVTSAEKTNGGFAARRPISLVIRNIDNKWLIDEVCLGAYEDNNSIKYENTRYGFSFTLPKSWQGYAIITDQWEGLPVNDSQTGGKSETGPMISIRHPDWTSQNPRQDIPIMVFTTDQWNSLQQDKFHIGAAPIGPSELGHNSQYVFALPARYNFAFPAGFEEVETILNGNPLQTTDPVN